MDDITLRSWLEQLAAKQPTPGGGGAAALAAAVSASLIGMVSQYTTGEKWAERSERMQRLANTAADLRLQALHLIQADADAFMKVGAAYSLPKASEMEKTTRQKAIQDAVVAAAEPPTQVVTLTMQLIDLAEELALNGNPAVISDVAVAASLAHAALAGAIVNIEINAKLLTSSAVQQALALVVAQAETGLQRADVVTAAVRHRIQA